MYLFILSGITTNAEINTRNTLSNVGKAQLHTRLMYTTYGFPTVYNLTHQHCMTHQNTYVSLHTAGASCSISKPQHISTPQKSSNSITFTPRLYDASGVRY